MSASPKRGREDDNIDPPYIFPCDGVKCSIEFPSGLVLRLFGLHVHFFGEMDIPYHFSFERALMVAEKRANDCGYDVEAIPEKSQMRLSGYEPEDEFLLTFSGKGLCDVENVANKRIK